MLFSKFATTTIATTNKTNCLVFFCRNILNSSPIVQPRVQQFWQNKPVFNLLVFERNLSRSLPLKQSIAICFDNKKEKEYNQNNGGSNNTWIGVTTFMAALTPVISAKEDEVEKKVKETKPRERFNFIADVVEMVIPSIVQIGIKTPTYYGQIDAASGSGFIVSEDGLVLTNAHVVRNYINDINVKLNDGRSFNGRVIKIDKSADLAIIKIDCNNLKPVKLGDSERVRTGEFVIALGSPLSLNNTVTSGVVSNPNRDGTELGLTNKLNYLQTDTIVTHGNSGGPLINLDGEVIGINTMTAAPGISFAIPSKYASEFLNTKTGSIASKYRYLGMKMISLTPQIFYLFNSQPSSDIHLPELLRQGCLVVDVAPNSPAERSGIKRGDVIIGANEHPIAKNADLFEILRHTPELRLIIIRESIELRVIVKADEKEG